MNARGVIKLRLAIHLAGAGAGSGSPIVENVKTLRCGNVTMRRFRLWLIAGENGAFPPTRNGCIHSLSMREMG